MGASATIKAYLTLCRISNLPSVWTNVLCALLLATGEFSWREYIVTAISLSCFYLAGMCLNDICDKEYDLIHRPSRPIPSGHLSVRGATTVTLFLFACGTTLLFATPHREGIYAAILLVAMIVWYDLYHKQNPFSVLLMASCRFLVYVVTALATTGSLSIAPIIAAWIQFSYVVCISLMARYENNRSAPFSFPLIPLMLAGISLLDGIILAIVVDPAWLLAGMGGATLLHWGQKFVKGD